MCKVFFSLLSNGLYGCWINEISWIERMSACERVSEQPNGRRKRASTTETAIEREWSNETECKWERASERERERKEKENMKLYILYEFFFWFNLLVYFDTFSFFLLFFWVFQIFFLFSLICRVELCRIFGILIYNLWFSILLSTFVFFWWLSELFENFGQPMAMVKEILCYFWLANLVYFFVVVDFFFFGVVI